MSIQGTHNYSLNPFSDQEGALRFLPPNENWDSSKLWHTQLAEAVLDMSESRLERMAHLNQMIHQVQNTLNGCKFIFETRIHERQVSCHKATSYIIELVHQFFCT